MTITAEKWRKTLYYYHYYGTDLVSADIYNPRDKKHEQQKKKDTENQDGGWYKSKSLGLTQLPVAILAVSGLVFHVHGVPCGWTLKRNK